MSMIEYPDSQTEGGLGTIPVVSGKLVESKPTEASFEDFLQGKFVFPTEARFQGTLAKAQARGVQVANVVDTQNFMKQQREGTLDNNTLYVYRFPDLRSSLPVALAYPASFKDQVLRP